MPCVDEMEIPDDIRRLISRLPHQLECKALPNLTKLLHQIVEYVNELFFLDEQLPFRDALDATASS